MLNLADAPMLKEKLVDNMKDHPFSIAIDGSNDTGLEKMNPITVRIYDLDKNKLSFDMCTLVSATAEGIYILLIW